MRKTFRILFSLIAMFGILNCFILEPALAAHQETTCASDDGCDDCFLCCSLFHQIVPETQDPFTPTSTVATLMNVSTLTRLDSPTFSIFHPPLAV